MDVVAQRLDRDPWTEFVFPQSANTGNAQPGGLEELGGGLVTLLWFVFVGRMAASFATRTGQSVDRNSVGQAPSQFHR